jgi:hypothetical protein
MKCVLRVMRRPFHDTNVERVRVTCPAVLSGLRVVSSSPLRYSSLILLLLTF